MSNQPIRVGVVGVGRGKSFAQSASGAVGMELVALCDIWEERLRELAGELSVDGYTDYDAFLAHDMDAVVLANYFHEHAPFAIKALRTGKHVMSETACNGTLAEGVALCRAVEESGRIYMLAENYPYTVFNQEMHRLYREGEIGEVTYAEGEYNHPMSRDASLRISPGFDHWREWIPSTYYCTHALAPLVYITDTRPVGVNALAIARPERTLTLRRGDPGSVILCRMDNGAVFRLFGLGLPGHSNWYRLHGERGAMEITRGPGYFGPGDVRVWHEPWHLEPGEDAERVYIHEMLSVRGQMDLQHYEGRLETVLGQMGYPVALEILTETAVKSRLDGETVNRYRAHFASDIEDATPSVEDVLHVLEHDGYLERMEGDYRFVSKLLEDWWRGRHGGNFESVVGAEWRGPGGDR